jgi:hypothetical protein
MLNSVSTENEIVEDINHFDKDSINESKIIYPNYN